MTDFSPAYHRFEQNGFKNLQILAQGGAEDGSKTKRTRSFVSILNGIDELFHVHKNRCTPAEAGNTAIG